jgi:hypothetical protein
MKPCARTITALIATVALLPEAAEAREVSTPTAEANSTRCGGHIHRHRGPEHKRWIFRRAWDDWPPPGRRARRKHGHMRLCARRPVKVHRDAMAHHWRKGRRLHHRRYRWHYRWRGLASWERSWARSTSACESDYPSQHGGGGAFHGGFQFLLSTWATSPRSPGGDPHALPWVVQAVVAVYLMRRDGASHWPNCG